MNKFKKSFLKGVLFLIVGSLMFGQTAQAFTNIQLVLGGEQPVISSPTVVPNSFSPQNGETAEVWFSLNTNADYSIEILKNPNNDVVWKGASKAEVGGLYKKAWDGKANYGQYSGTYAPAGLYTVKITAKKIGYEDDVNFTFVTVEQAEQIPAPTTVPTISNVTAAPAYPQSFNPQAGGTVEIKFSLNKPATYHVDMIKGGVVVANVTPGAGVAAQNAGYHTATWNGKISSGAYADEGTYMARVKAQNSAGWAVAEYALVLIDYPAETPPTGNAPNVTNDYAFPNPFDPITQTTKIYYTLNTTSIVTVSVLSGTDSKTLKNAVTESAGTYYVSWDGTNAVGTKVANGSQVYKIIAQNSYGYDVEMGTVDVSGSTGTGTGTGTTTTYLAPSLLNLYATPSIFDPLEGSTSVCYTVTADASISIAILDSEIEVKKLINSASRTAGSHCEAWNGKATSGSYANSGMYNIKVFAVNSLGYDLEFTPVQVNLNQFYTPTSAPDISGVNIEPDPFNPAIENEAIIYYQINKKANVNISIETLSGVNKKTLIDGKEKSQGSHWVKWSGYDKFGNPMEAGEYRIRVEAWNVYGMDLLKKKFYLGPAGSVVFVPVGEKCAGFLDVGLGNPYCKAITMVKNTGIFQGYPDGTFKPNQPINRAETVKVILLALNKSLLSPDGTNLGFWDVAPFDWYTSYLRTAKIHGIINGYPDGTFKPGNTVNRAELLKMFLEATEIAIPGCYGQPYPDVPANSPWYLKYACFAKQYDLVEVDTMGRMKPGTPMTRGGVADLFLRFQSAGLFDVFPLNLYY